MDVELLQKILKERPELKLLGKKKLKQELKSEGIKGKVIDDYYDKLEINQIFSKARPNKNISLKINAPPNCFQVDIVLLSKYKASNKGIDKFLLLVDILSRKAFAYVLKSGKADDVLDAYKKFVEDLGENKLNSVSGDEFFGNAKFLKYNEEIGVNVYHDIAKNDHITKQGNKLGIIDRLVLTLKRFINKYMILHDTTKWTKFLKDIIDLYNNTYHSSIKRKPNNAYNDTKFLNKLYKKQKDENEAIKNKIDLEVGNIVRAVKAKDTFDKEGARFSKKLYVISEINGNRYILMDEDGNISKRRYKPSELLRVHDVEERLDNVNKKKDEKLNIHVRKLQKEFGTGYDFNLALAQGK
jgi:hypothetical protein